MRDLFTLRRMVISVLLVVAAVALVAAFNIGDDGPPLVARDTAVKAVEPAVGTQRARQSTIFFELQAQYQGTFESINNRPIPEDQVDVIDGLNRYSFTPGEGKEFETFPPGRNCAVARLWQRGQPADSGRTYAWCYSLH